MGGIRRFEVAGAVIPRHRVSPSASPMTGSSGVSSTPRPLDSITGVSGILDRPVKPGDDSWDGGRLDAVIARSVATKQSTPHMDSGLLRGACHRARIRATRWLAMTASSFKQQRTISDAGYGSAFPR